MALISALLAIAALGFSGRSAVLQAAPRGMCSRSELTMASTAPAIRAVDILTSDVQGLAVFYETCFGMERAEGGAEIGFPGDSIRLRLVESEIASFRVGEGFDAIAIYLPDVDMAANRAEVRGGSVIVPAAECTVGPSKIPDEPIGTKHVTYEALVSDPQGYRFRLIQRKEGPSRVAKVVYRVTDLEKSQQFYAELLGMTVLRWRSNLQSDPMEMSLTMQVGDPATLNGAAVLEEASAGASPVLELVYPFDTRKMDVGEGGAGRLTIAAADVADIATRTPSANAKTLHTDPAAGEARVQDPDGFEVRLVALAK
jgi:predicted enzyme related to lactoylglutathione lyase